MNIDFTTSLNVKGLETASFMPLNDIEKDKVNHSGRVNLDNPALTITTSESSPIDEVERVSEEDLRRDDDLGRLVMSAFDFKPPEMPEFV